VRKCQTDTGDLALLGPDEQDYQKSAPWNLSVRSEPRAVVIARHPGDIVRAIKYAAAHDLRVAVRSTGHGPVPLAQNVVLVITSRLAECSVDPTRRTARIGAGTTWRHIIDEAARYGLAPVCGSAPSVGAVGLLTGGGIGPLSRTFGVCSDEVRAIEVVTGRGERLRATPTQNPGLFWGLRGGKATLGIVTAIELDLVEIDEFYGGALWFDAADSRRILHLWRRMCGWLPEQANTSAAIIRLPKAPSIPEPLAGKQVLSIRYTSVGEALDAASYLDDIRNAATPLLDDVHTRPYTEIGRVHADPIQPMPVHHRSALLQDLPGQCLDRLVDAVGLAGNTQSLVELRLLGGAIAREPIHPSAVCHRDAVYHLFTSALQQPALDTGRHADEIIGAVTPWATGALLPNFAATDDPKIIRRCYTPDATHRLSALGEEHDPDHILAVGQVVRSDR
jgi:hypothetical protein